MKKIILLSLICVAFLGDLLACDQCNKVAQQTIAQCQTCITTSKTCLLSTAKLFEQCPLCKSSKSSFEKRCKTAIVFCNRLIAECNNLLEIGDKWARNDCKYACKKANAQCKKLANLCTKSIKPFTRCPRSSKKDTLHPQAAEMCSTCERTCTTSIKTFNTLTETLTHCKTR